MKRIDLEDRAGRTIGRIEIDSNGKETLKDKAGRKLGTYDPKTNITKDAKGRIVGKGNLLTTLLPPL